MKLRVVDLHRLLAGEPHHQRRHGDAMIHVGGDESAAGGAAAAMHNQIVTVDLDFDAVVAQQTGGAASRSNSLTRNSLSPRMQGHAFGEGGSNGKDWIFVDHGWRARGGNIDAAQARGAHT